MNGADVLCETLRAGGVDCVVGLPGTQNIALYEAVRRSGIRSVLTTHELAASFLANGYFRASGKIIPILTIPGPGFTFALTGVAEAAHDSAAVLHVTGQPRGGEKKFQFQSIDQRAMAAPIVKAALSIDRADEVAAQTARALEVALTGEPGPVLLEWSAAALLGAATKPAVQPQLKHAPPDAALVDKAAAMIGGARRPLLFVGQGAAESGALVRRLAEALGAPVLATTSGRGILPEDHRLALGFDYARSDGRALNELLAQRDCVLVLGAKLTAAATSVFGLQLSEAQLIHVDAGAHVLGANYPARIAINGRVETVLEQLVPAVEAVRASASGRHETEPAAEITAWKARLRTANEEESPDPVVHGVAPATAEAFFAALRRALPRDGIVVTDSGMHQHLARRYLDVLAPRGLIAPTDFQSMGFGLPAAIGAKLAAPARAVVAVIGDGAFSMTGMELATAVRERVPLTVVVFNDGRLNKIRLQQLAAFGRTESVDLLNPDFEAFAAAMGARYARIAGDPERVLRDAIAGDEVTVVEVLVGDAPSFHTLRAKGYARHNVRRALGPDLIRWVKRTLKR